MLNLPRLATRVATVAIAGALSACSAIQFGIANAPAALGPFERTADVAYGSDPRQKLGIYVPKAEGAATRPVVIFWYGCSRQSGSKSDYRFVGAELADHGYITVLPDYRVYPEVKFPAFLDDAAH